MKDMLIIIGTKNKDKIMALHQAIVAQAGSFSKKEYTLIVDNQRDILPLRRLEIINGAEEQALGLFQLCSKESWFDLENTVTMGIQKGTNLLDLDELPELSCAVSIYIPKEKKMISVMSEEDVPLSQEIRQLVYEEKMDLYDAYGKVYGEKVKNKEILLYEYLTKKSQIDWIAATIHESLKCL